MISSFFQNITVFLKGEFIKKKKSGFYWIAAILGLLFPVSIFISNVIEPTVFKPSVDFNIYEMFFTESARAIAFFSLTISIIHNSSKIAQLDHKSGGWQLMELLPLQKSSIYFGKFLILISSSALLIITYIFSGLLFTYSYFLFNDLPANAITEIPWSFIGKAFLKIILASWFLTAIQYTLSVLISSYIWSLSIGFLAFIISSILEYNGKFHPSNPFQVLSHTGQNIQGGDLDNYIIYTEYFSLFAGTVILIFGFLWYKNKGFIRAFWKSNYYRIRSIIGMLLILLLSISYLAPKKQFEHNRTIIMGDITSDLPISMAYLIHPTIKDTVAKIEVSNGQFKHIFKDSLPLSNYILIFQNYGSAKVVMGTNDSIVASVKFQNGRFDYKIKGNRIAENNFKSKIDEWPYVKYQIKEGFDLHQYQNLQNDLLNIAQNDLKNIKEYRSKDNLTYRDDLKEIIEKEIILDNLLYKEMLSKKVGALYPEKRINWNIGWEELENRLSLNDLQMLDKEKYLEYLELRILKNDTSELAGDIKLLQAFQKLPKGEFKDKIMYSKLSTLLENSNTNSERDELYKYSKNITSQKFRNNLKFLHQNLQKLGRGKLAFNFSASDLQNKNVRLSDLKGKWIIINFYQSWSELSSNENSYFENIAFKYQKNKIAFVSLSTDQNKSKWVTEAKNKSKKVLQWYANNSKQVNFNYQITSIPRFVMIDPEGKIYQSKMARPSEASFEMILRKALDLRDLE
ncbi:redoxin domain-containing protein [Flavobacterium sedimenticola]|uniref:Redoxin domain-containing protein n=1 Tax=Flavobacterium sedimenticola TaxID=3043286 RepID=A0ABT6XS81_9FLAO|nr:redoxin domain-containing protein [Flavobacterium sedimenticola]MDI9257916.1 redoxin domain-containing protein [Flavobacterium sedimenticola]